MRNKQAGLLRKPIIRKMPPKNSVVLQSQAFNRGNGISKDCKYFAKSSPYFDVRRIIHEK
jgi:hypothetical protein